MKRWLLKRSKINTKIMAEELGIREATATVLANRNITERKQSRLFLQGDLKEIPSALLMKDMEKGLELIRNAIELNKKIAIYGDYDVDGVTSTTILYKTICRCGGDAIYYLPHRQKEGYGLNLEAVESLASRGVELLLTCDNGISAIAEIELAKKSGLEVVILDHHEPAFVGENEFKKDILPSADAIIDPKQESCDYPFPMLCAGGISYKFSLQLLQQFSIFDAELEEELLVFASIATVCDIVDLLEENRVIVRHGLQAIHHTKNLGLRALLQETNIADVKISEYHLGFIIGPCINATGRLESGEKAVELFTTTDPNSATEIAKTLVSLNEERKALTAQATERLLLLAEEQVAEGKRVLVLFDKLLHESIAGIVAGRIKDTFYRPTILITLAEEGAKGSGRSIEGYNLFNALFACKELFTRFGGHAMAAGLSLPVENIPLLAESLNESCTLTDENMTPILRIEKALSFMDIDMTLAQELQNLSPFGKENPAPLFATKNILVDRLSLIGKNKDMLRMTLLEKQTGMRLAAVSFDGLERLKNQLKELYPQQDCVKILEGGKLTHHMDFVYSIDINTYNGRSSVQLIIKDFRIS